MWSGPTYESPFRLKHALPPAFLTERMALPWQAIFPPATSCRAPRNDRSTTITKDGIPSPVAFEAKMKAITTWCDVGRNWLYNKKGGKFFEDGRSPSGAHPGRMI